MTTRDPRHEPLDTNERELARVVRALPGGEPPAALDAMILKASQDAVAAAPTRRPSRWLAGGAIWGIGSAAAAVLAIGVGWQVMNPSPATQLPMPARAPAAAAADAAVDETAGTSVEFRDQSPKPFDNSAPPSASAEPAPPLARARTRADAFPASSPPASAAAPTPAPIATAPPVTAQATGTVNAIDVTSVESTTILTAEQMQKLDQESALRDSAAPMPSAALGSAGRVQEETSKRVQPSRAEREAQSDARNSAKAEADFRGRPTSWLAHIRSLRDDGDIPKARESLGEFRKRYPDFVVPSDLIVLLDP